MERRKLLEVINDAVEKYVDQYNEENECEVELNVERNVEGSKENENADTLTIDGGNQHGLFEIMIVKEA